MSSPTHSTPEQIDSAEGVAQPAAATRSALLFALADALQAERATQVPLADAGATSAW